MQTTGDLSGAELPQRLPKIVRRFNIKKKKEKKVKNKITKLLWEKSGNHDWWNEPGQIGKGWKKAYKLLDMIRKSNYFDTDQDNYGTGKAGKSPGFFHKKKGQ